MGSKYLEYPSAGVLGCISASFVAGTGWRRTKARDPSFNSRVDEYLDLLWKFLKPVSFSLIGKEVDFKVLDGNIVLYGLIALLAGVIVRLVTGYLSFCGGNMNRKEKAYITLSGFPKATGKWLSCLLKWATLSNCKLFFPTPVQAALGPVALDLARYQNSSDEIRFLANSVLVISVLAIISTAPLGEIFLNIIHSFLIFLFLIRRFTYDKISSKVAKEKYFKWQRWNLIEIILAQLFEINFSFLRILIYLLENSSFNFFKVIFDYKNFKFASKINLTFLVFSINSKTHK